MLRKLYFSLMQFSREKVRSGSGAPKLEWIVIFTASLVYSSMVTRTKHDFSDTLENVARSIFKLERL